MPMYRTQSGDMGEDGVWLPGSYQDEFEAATLPAAQAQVDRRLRDRHRAWFDTGSAVKIDGDGESSWRDLKNKHQIAVWSKAKGVPPT